MFTRSRRVGKKKGYKDPTFSQIFNTSLDSQTGETEVLQNPKKNCWDNNLSIIEYEISRGKKHIVNKIHTTFGSPEPSLSKKTVLSGLSRFMDRPRVSCLCDHGSTCPKPKKKEGDLSKTKICNTFFQWMVFFSVYQKLFFENSVQKRANMWV